jgi:DNA repair protein SbcD/Mre11
VGPLKLLHFADLHLGVESGGRIDPATGYNQRWVDVCDRLDEVCRVCEAEGVHAVLFAGDAFKHQHPNPTLQSLFAERIRRLARSGAAVFLLVGNHDLPKMRHHAHPFSIYDALEVDGVVVGDKAEVYSLTLGADAPAEVLQVAALPHFSRQEVLLRYPDLDIDEAVAERVNGLSSHIDPTRPSAFVGHCHVQQAELGTATSSFDLSEVQISLSSLVGDPPFPYYALGHVHHRQVLSEHPPVTYPGSLERTDFGEGARVDAGSNGKVRTRKAEPKGFYRVDLERSDHGWKASAVDFREVAARAFVTIRAGELDTTDPVRDLGARIDRVREEGVSLEGAFVRVMVTLPGSERGRLSAGAVREMIGEAYDARLSLETADTPAVRDPRFARTMGEAEALESYLQTREDWAEDREALLQLGRELIAEADTS